jgi:hypothetical protein
VLKQARSLTPACSPAFVLRLRLAGGQGIFNAGTS